MSTADRPLGERLVSVLARAADTVSVSQPPPLLPRRLLQLARRRRRTTRRWVGAGVGVALVLSGTSIAAAGLLAPRTSYDPLTTTISPTSPAIARAVGSALPPDSHVVSTHHVEISNNSYDDTVIAAPNGTYDFTVYQKFSSSELDHFGLARHQLPDGTAWIGADSPQQRSVYFLNTAGVGVYVSHTSPTGHSESIHTLEGRAQRLAASLAPR